MEQLVEKLDALTLDMVEEYEALRAEQERLATKMRDGLWFLAKARSVLGLPVVCPLSFPPEMSARRRVRRSGSQLQVVEVDLSKSQESSEGNNGSSSNKGGSSSTSSVNVAGELRQRRPPAEERSKDVKKAGDSQSAEHKTATAQDKKNGVVGAKLSSAQDEKKKEGKDDQGEDDDDDDSGGGDEHGKKKNSPVSQDDSHSIDESKGKPARHISAASASQLATADPLYWYTSLPPTTLRQAQAQFIEALQASAEVASKLAVLEEKRKAWAALLKQKELDASSR